MTNFVLSIFCLVSLTATLSFDLLAESKNLSDILIGIGGPPSVSEDKLLAAFESSSEKEKILWIKSLYEDVTDNINKSDIYSLRAGYQNFFGFRTEKAMRDFKKSHKIFFDFDDLLKILDNAKAKDLKSFVFSLPEEVRERSLIAFQSEGLESSKGHPATDEKPRVILFNPDAKLLIAFQEGIEAIEVIRQTENNSERPFEFYRHSFEVKKEERDSIKNLNPAICYDCHTRSKDPKADLRVNWLTYFLWKGFLRGNDDVVGLDRNKLNALNRSAEKEIIGMEKFQRYLATHPDSVYHLLPNLNERFFDRSQTVFERGSDGQRPHSSRPNLHFSSLVSINNAERLAGKLINQKNYFKYRHLMAAALMGCNSINVESEVEFSKNSKKLNDQLWKEFNQVGTIYYNVGEGNLISDPYSTGAVPEFLNKIYLIELLSGDLILNKGKNLANWSTIPFKNSPLAIDPFSTGKAGIQSLMYASLFQQDPVLEGEATERGRYPTCEELRSLAERELKNLLQQKGGYQSIPELNGKLAEQKDSIAEERLTQSAQHIFQENCSDCHSKKENKLNINAEDLDSAPVSRHSKKATKRDEILDRLQVGHPRKMPKDGNLDPTEAELLKNYILR